MCWCVLDGSVCLRAGVPIWLVWVGFLVRVGMYWFVLHSWRWDLHGYSSVLGFGQVVSSYAGSCFLYFMKVVALFSSSSPMIIQSETVRQCYKYLLH